MEEMLTLLLFWCCLFCYMGVFAASGNVVLIGNNVTLSFEDIEAAFAPPVTGSGKCGTLNVAEPLDACSPLTNKIVSKINDTRYPFVLIIRGGCSFDDKVRRAQAAGFKAAIVYDNETGALVAMAGKPFFIKIHAVFVSKVSGETLARYAGAADVELWIVPGFENTSWSIIVISFISLLAMSAVLASCFFVRRRQIRRQRPRASRVREFHGISSRLVKAMPTLIFSAVKEDNCTAQTCTICLEDYSVGEKLRILPCCHKFHASCIDTWLTSWRTFCPVCKRDARTSTGQNPSSESTPLLSSTAAPISSSSAISTPLLSSTAAPVSSSSRSSFESSVQCPQTISNILDNEHSLQSPQLRTSQGSVIQPNPVHDIESSPGSSPSESFIDEFHQA